MKALITGASGFIGSTLVQKLNQMGVDVRVLLRKTSRLDLLEGCTYQTVFGSLEDQSSLEQAVEGVDWVFHLAGVVKARDRSGYIRANAEGTSRLAEAVAKINPNLKRFVLVSSLAAGGPAEGSEPRCEEHDEAPVSYYGESKLLGEKAILPFKDRFPIVILRPPVVYGPRDTAFFLFVKTVNRNLMPVMTAKKRNEKKLYSTIYVDDLCEGMILAAKIDSSQFSSGEIFYVSHDEVTTYEEILTTIASHLDRKPIRFSVPRTVVRLAAEGASWVGSLTGKAQILNRDKANEILADYWICSNQKAKRILGFTPQFDFKKGMGKAIEWYRENRWI